MEKKHIGQAERLWIAGEIQRLISIAVDSTRTESRWADNLIRNAYLWYWTADGVNADGEVQRDLFKRDTNFLRHSLGALKALEEKRKVVHEHAVPRNALLKYLKSRTWESPAEIMTFLDHFCFGVIIDKLEEPLLQWKQDMPNMFSLDTNPLERYVLAGIEIKMPKYPRL